MGHVVGAAGLKRAFLIAVYVVCAAHGGFIGDRRALLRSAAGGNCSQATAFLARTSGLSGTETAAYKAMICGMVTDGTWSKLDVLYVFATNTQTTALLNLVSTSYTGTVHGTVSFAADQGYTGDGSTFYIDSPWQPATGPNFTQNGAAYGLYSLTSVAGASSFAMGEDTAFFDIDLSLLTGGGLLNASICSTAATLSVANSSTVGQYIVSRTSSSNTAVYKNGSATPFVNSTTDTSHALTAQDLYFFARNDLPGPAGFWNGKLSAGWAGGAMTAAQAANVASRVNAYMTALGINVY
jgi:hypothetical protein